MKKSKKKHEKSKSKKHKKRSHASSSEIESDQEPNKKGKEELKMNLKMKKELEKALETPEEKRARRIKKKEDKERKKRMKMGWDNEYMGYTNTDNPFGDSHLLNTFVWHKKLDSGSGSQPYSEHEKKMIMKSKQETNKHELAKVKQQRIERDHERQLRDQEAEIMQREKEAEHFKVWEQQEDKFHLEQAKLRSRIRIQDGRAKPIDLLAQYLTGAEDDSDMSGIEMNEPYTFLNGLTITDLEDLLADIKVYIELEQGKNGEFWKDMTVITEDELSKLRAISAEEESTSRDTRREGVNKAVSSDVTNVFKNKTHKQLVALQTQMMSRIKAGGSSLDIGYWESLLSQLKAHMARARIRDNHQELLKKKLLNLKLEQLGEVADDTTETSTKQPAEETSEQDNEAEEEEENENLLLEECLKIYEEGGYSPRLVQQDDLKIGTVFVDANEAALTLEGRRKLLQNTGSSKTGTEDAFVEHVKKKMDQATDEEEGSATFAVEAKLSQQVYLWADKYRPRKPRFFNRVHTGFEWNKYNQTHYDFDNPPPKIVQGYKFNIFYPDLIDKSTAPSYSITPCEGSKDFAILRFMAGSPYEDIAFKIVNREWEYSHKHGFRCQFLNSIFQLWFHFKRYRYRR